MAKTNGPEAKLLFKHTEGTVTMTVYGPPIGWRWTKVNYFRLVSSTKDPARFERREVDREIDQQFLRQANAAALDFYADREQRLKENYGRPRGM